jgi:hypothetical protein
MKSKAFDVAEKYLKRQVGELPVDPPEIRGGDDDPVLSADDWYVPFRDFHHGVIREADLDLCRLRQDDPELYKAIKDQEAKLNALGEARLSEVMAIMREWRKLVLRAELEQRATREAARHETF